MTTIPYEEALATANPVMALRSLLAGMLERGEASRDELFAALNQIRLELRREGAEQAEDVVAEVMDFMVGWCSPRMKF